MTNFRIKPYGNRLASLTAVVALAICGLPGSSGCSTAPAATETPPPKVTVAHPENRELTDFDEYNGWTDASANVEVRSRVRGHVVKVHFTDGDFVEKDDLLFELDPRPYQSEIDRAKEQLNVAAAQQYAAKQDEARIRTLYKQNVATPSEMEKSEAALKTWDAQVASADEEVKRRELELTYSKVTAPIGGKIGRALITEGNLVNAGGSDPVMTTIVTLNPIDVYFAVDERSLLRYRQRNKVTKEKQHDGLEKAKIPFEFGLETDQGYPHKGVLDFANNRIDSTTGTIEVRGKADNEDQQFIPGGRVRVRVGISDPYQALLVPDTAVLTDQDRKYVLVVNEKNIVLRRNIKPGKLLPDGMRVVLPSSDSDGDDSKLTVKDWIVVLGLQRARINYPIEPMDAEGKPIK